MEARRVEAVGIVDQSVLHVHDDVVQVEAGHDLGAGRRWQVQPSAQRGSSRLEAIAEGVGLHVGPQG